MKINLLLFTTLTIGCNSQNSNENKKVEQNISSEMNIEIKEWLAPEKGGHFRGVTVNKTTLGELKK